MENRRIFLKQAATAGLYTFLLSNRVVANSVISKKLGRVLLDADFKTNPFNLGWKTENGTWSGTGEAGGKFIDTALGAWTSPEISIPPYGYYKLSFRCKTDEKGLWGVVFKDINGNELQTDIYDSVFPSDDWANQDFCFRSHPLANTFRLTFQTATKPVLISLVKVEEVDVAGVENWIKTLSSKLHPIIFKPDAIRERYLSKTKSKLANGGKLRIVLLGDSTINDTGNSLFEALLKREYPQTTIEVVNSVRGSTGCPWYQNENRVEGYVLRFNPDLLVIGGISNNYDVQSIKNVIRQVKAKQSPDILVLTDSITPETIVHKRFFEQSPGIAPEMAAQKFNNYPVDLATVCREENAGFLDMRKAWNMYIQQSKHPVEWFLRDEIHANSRGKQIAGQILAKYLLAE